MPKPILKALGSRRYFSPNAIGWSRPSMSAKAKDDCCKHAIAPCHSSLTWPWTCSNSHATGTTARQSEGVSLSGCWEQWHVSGWGKGGGDQRLFSSLAQLMPYWEARKPRTSLSYLDRFLSTVDIYIITIACSIDASFAKVQQSLFTNEKAQEWHQD